MLFSGKITAFTMACCSYSRIFVTMAIVTREVHCSYNEFVLVKRVAAVL